MCEAVEDLARDEAVDRPDLAAMLLQAARTERARRGLPLRQRDAQELAVLEGTRHRRERRHPRERRFQRSRVGDDEMTDRSILIHAGADDVYPLIADPIRMARVESRMCPLPMGRRRRSAAGRRPLPRDEPQRVAPVDHDVDDRRDARRRAVRLGGHLLRAAGRPVGVPARDRRRCASGWSKRSTIAVAGSCARCRR